MLTGLHAPARAAFGPSFTVFRHIAIFAWVPLITAWFGLGELAKLIFVGLACWLPMQLATERGVRLIAPTLGDVAHSLRFTFAQRLRWLVLPGATPAIFAALRISLINAWAATIGAEYFMTAGRGIGAFLIDSQQLLRGDEVLAATLLVGLTALLLGILGDRLERRATRWRHQ